VHRRPPVVCVLTVGSVPRGAAVLFGANRSGLRNGCRTPRRPTPRCACSSVDRLASSRRKTDGRMLAHTEARPAAVWDRRARPTLRRRRHATPSIAGAAAPRSPAFRQRQDCCQTLGACGCTWSTTRQCICAARSRCIKSSARPKTGASRRAIGDGWRPPKSTRRRPAQPKEAYREKSGRSSPNQRVCLATRLTRLCEPLITPGWPTPWGLDAERCSLLVIEDEFRAAKGVRGPNIGVGAGWALPNSSCRTSRQQERWISDAEEGDLWCSCSASPGAGLRPVVPLHPGPRAFEGVGCSTDRKCDVEGPGRRLGICLASANPMHRSTTASRALVDMRPRPRGAPLRELTRTIDVQAKSFFNAPFVP